MRITQTLDVTPTSAFEQKKRAKTPDEHRLAKDICAALTVAQFELASRFGGSATVHRLQVEPGAAGKASTIRVTFALHDEPSQTLESSVKSDIDSEQLKPLVRRAIHPQPAPADRKSSPAKPPAPPAQEGPTDA